MIGELLRRHRLNGLGVHIKPAAARATVTKVEVEVHHRDCDNLQQETKLERVKVNSDDTDKFDAVKFRDCVNNGLESNDIVLNLLNNRAQPRTRRTIELNSFDNVFSPYIRPPT